MHVYVYGPSRPPRNKWWTDCSPDDSVEHLFLNWDARLVALPVALHDTESKPRLLKLVKLARSLKFSALPQRPVLEEWVSGRVVTIGQAAHCLPVLASVYA